MKGIHTEVKTITQVERRRNTPSGNPRYRVVFSDGTDALTKDDAAVNYDISNSDVQGVPVTVTFEDQQIIGVEPTEPT